MSVPAERFDGRKATAATVYHYVDREWTPLETDLVTDSGDACTFAATTDGFSTFAVGIDSVEAADAANESSTETTASTGKSTDETPDFTLFGGFLSVLTQALAASQQME